MHAHIDWRVCDSEISHMLAECVVHGLVVIALGSETAESIARVTLYTKFIVEQK